MRTRLSLLVASVLIATSLATATVVNAGTRRTVSYDFSAASQTACPSFHWCPLSIWVGDISVFATYAAWVEFEPNVEPSASNKGARCTAGTITYCNYVTVHTCTTSGCAQWGGGSFDPGNYPETVDTWIYTSGRFKATITGTTDGYIDLNGVRIATWN